MKSIKIWPGNMSVALDALSLFGKERLNAGTWMSPVEVYDLTDDEVKFAKEYFNEYNVDIIKRL